MDGLFDVGETPTCGEHPRTAAEALCLKHRQFVCMKCIVEDKKHSSKKCETKTLRNMCSESDQKLVQLLLMNKAIVKRREQLEKHVTHAERKREELRAQIDSYYTDITFSLQKKYAHALKYVDEKTNIVKENNTNRLQAIDTVKALFEGEIGRLTDRKSKAKEISMAELSKRERSLPATCLTIVTLFQSNKQLKEAVSSPLGEISYIEDDLEAYDMLDEGGIKSNPPSGNGNSVAGPDSPPYNRYEAPIKKTNKPSKSNSDAYEDLVHRTGLPEPLPVPDTPPLAGSSYERTVTDIATEPKFDDYCNADKGRVIDTSCPTEQSESSPTDPGTLSTPTGRRAQSSLRSNSIVEKYFPGIESGVSSVKPTTPINDKVPTFVAQTSQVLQHIVSVPNKNDSQTPPVSKHETSKIIPQSTGYLSISGVKLDSGAIPAGSKITSKAGTARCKQKCVETRSVKLTGETIRRRRLTCAVLLPANRLAFLDEQNSSVLLARTDGRLICEMEGEQLLYMAGCGRDDIAVLGRSKGLHITVYMAFGERSLERRVCVQVAAPEISVVNGFQFDDTLREFAIGGAGKVLIIQESGRMKTSVTFKNSLPERCDAPDVRTCYDFQDNSVYMLFTKTCSLVKYNFSKQEVAWQTRLESGKQTPSSLCLGKSLVYVAFPSCLQTYLKATGISDWPVDTSSVLNNISGVSVDERASLALVTFAGENEDAPNTFAIVGL
ncbi:uncharacterized protein LOC127864042 [Dreissena polymorpha]|nr:uncharacterized protein LOC127864042 [Dreissena polymorpha]XP_052259681.1 uncharacterized protein LOC127864042 [Dreissena polymorpha]